MKSTHLDRSFKVADGDELKDSLLDVLEAKVILVQYGDGMAEVQVFLLVSNTMDLCYRIVEERERERGKGMKWMRSLILTLECRPQGRVVSQLR
jgi:hypothetical protein